MQGFDFPYPENAHPWRLPAVLSIAGLLALGVDLPIAQWCLADHVPRDVRKLLQLSEAFGHGLGIAVILITVCVLARSQRWKLPRLVAAVAGAGVAANVAKLLIARVRPHHFDFSGGVGTSFVGWLPLASGPSFEQGCPSAHTAAAAALAVGLAWLYPHARSWFACLAMLVAMQRIETGAHFVSDTLWGAALGVAAARVAITLPSLGLLGNGLERWLGKPDGAQSAANDALHKAA